MKKRIKNTICGKYTRKDLKGPFIIFVVSNGNWLFKKINMWFVNWGENWGMHGIEILK